MERSPLYNSCQRIRTPPNDFLSSGLPVSSSDSLSYSKSDFFASSPRSGPTPKQKYEQIFTPDELENINIMADPKRNRRERMIAQSKIEEKLLKKYSCAALNPDIVSHARYQIFNIDDVILGNIMKKVDGLNSNLHSNLSCAVDAIISNDESGLFVPEKHERVRNWFRSIRQIGSDSINGYALGSSFTNQSHLFILKTPRRLDRDELLHETFIGLYALNNVRQFVPNFMYIYGYVKCSSAVLLNKEVITWCSSNEPGVSYMIAENVQNSVPIKSFIADPNITVKDFVDVFLQVINALAVANIMYGFTHYDLHTDNILIKKLDKKVAIPIYNSQMEILGYVITEYIPYIIDYGYSTINYKGYGFGKIGLEFASVGTKSFPMYDVYKLLGFMGQDLRYTHTAIDRTINKLFQFFNEGDIIHRVEKRLGDRRDYYKVSDKLSHVTHHDYMDWVFNESGVNVAIYTSLPANIQVAPLNTPMETCEFYNLAFAEKRPYNALEYCDLVTSLNNAQSLDHNTKTTVIKKINDKFRAQDYFNRTYPFAMKKLQGVQNKHYQIPDANYIDITNINTVNDYRETVYELLEVKDIVSELVSYVRANSCSLDLQKGLSDDALNKLNTLSNALKLLLAAIEQNKVEMQRNNTIVTSKLKSMDTKKIDRKVLTYWATENILLYSAL